MSVAVLSKYSPSTSPIRIPTTSFAMRWALKASLTAYTFTHFLAISLDRRLGEASRYDQRKRCVIGLNKRMTPAAAMATP